MKFEPLGNRVLVKRAEEETMTPGGIVIPDAAKEKPLKGKVVSFGPGRTLDDGRVNSMPFRKNDTVLFGRYAGTEVKLEDESFIILTEEDILGRIVE